MEATVKPFTAKPRALRLAPCVLFLLLGFLFFTGCMADHPDDGDLPWNRPDERDAMIPLPNSMYNRNN